MSNLESDIAQLQAVFKFLKHEGKPYWNGAIDGIMTNELGTAIRAFQRNEEGLEETGIIRAASGDKTRARIRERCRGTPFADMRGIEGTTIIFSRIKAPTVQIQKPLSDLDLWQAAGNDAAAYVKATAIDLMLPMSIKQEDVGTHAIEHWTHFKFTVSTPEVLWLSKATKGFSPEIPEEADQFLKKHLVKSGSYVWLSGRMTFLSTESYEKIEELNIWIKEYDILNDRLVDHRFELKNLGKEVLAIVKHFAVIHKKHEARMDEELQVQLGILGIDLIYEITQIRTHVEKSGNALRSGLGTAGRGISNYVLNILTFLKHLKTYVRIFDYARFLWDAYFDKKEKLDGLMRDIRNIEHEINVLVGKRFDDGITIEGKLSSIERQLKKNGIKNIVRFKKAYFKSIKQLDS